MTAQREQPSVLLVWSKMVPRVEGQDPLGLNLRVSARMSAQLLHCITSITPRARYFSFFPWCLLSTEKIEDAKLKEAIRLRETALTLGCVIHHGGRPCEGGRLVGSDEAVKWVAKHGQNATVQLNKLQFSKNPAWDAYFASMVSLGFFLGEDVSIDASAPENGEDLLPSELKLSELGRAVAMSYANAVDSTVAVGKLSDSRCSYTARDLDAFGAAGGLCEVTSKAAPDREILRNLFFNRIKSPGQSHIFRQQSLTLLLYLVNQCEGYDTELTESDFREAVYFGSLYRGAGRPSVRLAFPDSLTDVTRRWMMFYFHYYLSVALESVFVAIVASARCAGLAGVTIDQFVAQLGDSSTSDWFRARLGKRTGRHRLTITFRELFAQAGLMVTSPHPGDDGRVWASIDGGNPISEPELDVQLAEGIDRQSPEGIFAALLLLMVTLGRFQQWENTPHAQWLGQAVDDPYKDVTLPVVLRELRDKFADFWDAPLSEIASFIARRFVVRQHETLAYDKSWNGSRAFIGMDGETIYWRQLNYDDIGVLNARFRSTIQILLDLSFIAKGTDRVPRLTADGKKWLERELTQGRQG